MRPARRLAITPGKESSVVSGMAARVAAVQASRRASRSTAAARAPSVRRPLRDEIAEDALRACYLSVQWPVVTNIDVRRLAKRVGDALYARERFSRCLEHDELRAVGDAHHARHHAVSAGVALDVGVEAPGAERYAPLRSVEGLRRVLRFGKCRSQRYDGQRSAWGGDQRGPRCDRVTIARPTRRVEVLEEYMGVGAAEAEAGRPGPAGEAVAVVIPRRRRERDDEGARRVLQRAAEAPDARLRRNAAVAHRQRELDDAGDASGPPEVAEDALDAPQMQRARRVQRPEELRQRCELRGVSHGRSGGMSLDHLDSARVDATRAVGAAQREHLAPRCGRVDGLAASVAGGSYAEEDSMNCVAVGDRVVEAAERDESRAVAEDGPISVGVEGAAAHGGEARELGEIHLSYWPPEKRATAERGIDASFRECAQSVVDGVER
jgi:hypothetical protein